MARMPIAAVCAAAVLFTGCNRDASDDSLRQAVAEDRQQSERQNDTDPSKRPRPDDRNPLRRQLGDLQIKELFFGPDQTQGDWIAWLPCSQAHAGLPVAPANRIYLKRCAALEQYLLKRAQDGGFPEAAVDDVMDPRISGAST